MANVVADALSRKSGMIAGIKVEEEIIRDLERLKKLRRRTSRFGLSSRTSTNRLSFTLIMTMCYDRILEWHEARCSHVCIKVFDLSAGLPPTQRRHDAIWVVVDRLTKSAHFLPIRKDYSVSRLADFFQQEIVRLHGTPSAIVSDRDPRFASRFWKGLQKAWGTRLKFITAFHPQTDGQSERTIQTLEDMLRSCALEWTGPEMIEVTNAKVAVAKEKLKE
nr:Gag protease polyprotein [Tanacetum cinerariifolium]